MPYSSRGGPQGNDWDPYNPYQRPNHGHYNRRQGPGPWQNYNNRIDNGESYQYNGWDKRNGQQMRNMNHGTRNGSPRGRGYAGRVENIKFKWVRKSENDRPLKLENDDVVVLDGEKKINAKFQQTKKTSLIPGSSAESTPNHTRKDNAASAVVELKSKGEDIKSTSQADDSQDRLQEDYVQSVSKGLSADPVSGEEDSQGSSSKVSVMVSNLMSDLCGRVDGIRTNESVDKYSGNCETSTQVELESKSFTSDNIDSSNVCQFEFSSEKESNKVDSVQSTSQTAEVALVSGSEKLLNKKSEILLEGCPVSSEQLESELSSGPLSDSPETSVVLLKDTSSLVETTSDQSLEAETLVKADENNTDSINAETVLKPNSCQSGIRSSLDSELMTDEGVDCDVDLSTGVRSTVDKLISLASGTDALHDLPGEIDTLKRKHSDSIDEMGGKRLKVGRCDIDNAEGVVNKEEPQKDDILRMSEMGDVKNLLDVDTLIDEPHQKRLNKMVQKLDRKKLEALVKKKVLEVITGHEQLGKQKRYITTLEEMVEKYKAKAVNLQKQANDFEIVFKKYAEDAKLKKGHLVNPVRISRSVGLQVQLPQNVALKPGLAGIKSPAKPINVKPDSNVSKTKPKPIVPQRVITNSNPLDPSPTPVAGVQPIRNASGTYTDNVNFSKLANLASPVEKTGIHPQASIAPKVPTSPNMVSGLNPSTLTAPRLTSNVVKVIDLTDDDDKGGRGGDKVLGIQNQVGNGSIITTGTFTVLSPMRPSQAHTASSPMAAVNVQHSNNSVIRSQGNDLGQPRVINRMQSNQIVGPITTVRDSRSLIAAAKKSQAMPTAFHMRRSHPAPLPPQPVHMPNRDSVLGLYPPKPRLKISKKNNGIDVSWSLDLNNKHADIASYQLFAYQEGSAQPTPSLWKKVGDVKALPLPMACTLTQFMDGHRYHFAVRAVDVHGRFGPFSDPGSIRL